MSSPTAATTPPARGAPAVDHSGYLLKSGGMLIKQNQTRYFELRGVLLYYFKTRPLKTTDVAQGCIDLTNTQCVANPKERFSWVLQGPSLPKSYVFTAASDSEMRTWMARMSHPNKNNTHRIKTADHNSDEDDGETTLYTMGSTKVSTNDFEVLCVIGKGSFGKVYKVQKRDTGELFAMKEMSKELIEREKLGDHIFAEKSILQKIRHPFIVTLHYAFQTQSRLYLVLELLSGGELFFHLGDAGQFNEYRAKFYCGEIGLALGHLHSLNIIYRDLKPENAVLDKDGHVCLTDFGLAKTNVNGAEASTFCGTPEYLAPEFLLGSTHGKAVDWWSLGILLYEMLCGIPPFYSENVDEMYELILKKELTFEEEAPSEAAQDLLRKLLERDPTKRLQDVEEFKLHAFFSDIDWVELYNRRVEPPFKPDSAALNFDSEFTSLPAHLSDQDEDGEKHSNIAGFTYDGNVRKKR